MNKSSQPSADFETDELLALARVDVEKNDLEAALRKLKTALTRPDVDPEAMAMGARLYAQLGLLGRAKALFEQYIAQRPEALNEKFQLGMVHFDSNDLSKAASLWEQVLAAHPTHPPALHYMGLLAAQQNRLPEARRHLEVLLKTAPSDNLYFQRSKELLHALDNNVSPPIPPERATVSEMPYPNEH